jgi:hypothetical protein
MKLISIPAISTAFLLATLTLQAAQAQTPAPRMVTRDELRVCMNSEGALKTRREAIDPRAKQNRDEAAAIRTEAEAMKEERDKLVEDQKPMDRFDRKVKAHNGRVKAAQDSAEAFRAELESLNKAMLAYNEQCGGITYLSEDKEAILKEREPAKN